MATILIGEVAPAARLLLKRSLEQRGHSVIEVSDGPAALEIGRKGVVDMAILDQLMPGVKGNDVLRIWREEGLVFPVVFLSAVDDLPTILASYEEGAVDYVRKPFSPTDLVARIDQILDNPN